MFKKFLVVSLIVAAIFSLSPLSVAYAQMDESDPAVEEFSPEELQRQIDEWEQQYELYQFDDEALDQVFDGDLQYDVVIQTEPTEADVAAFLMANLMIFLCFTIPAYIYGAVTLTVIARKVGEDNRWMAWVPVLNIFYMFKVAGLSPLLALALIVPFVNLVVAIYAWMKIAQRRGFEQWVGILTLVPFVGILVPAYLAWGNPSGSTSPPAAPAEPVAPSNEPPVAQMS